MSKEMEKLVHISSGRGPLECAFVVKKLLPILLNEARSFSLKTTIIDRKTGSHPSGLNSVTLLLKGNNLAAFLLIWEGSVLWQNKSPFRPQHRRKNWFVEVFSLYVPQSNRINEKDVVFQTIKSSGPGGQHVNKTNSAVRATYVPTKQSVLVQDSRSQHQNKKIALERLEKEINTANKSLIQEFEKEAWLNKINVQRGNPTRIFEGLDFKDVRLKMN
jgi:peptide chain release factor